MLGPEPRASTHEDSLLDTQIKYLLLDVENAAMRRIGVEIMVDL